MVRNKFKEESEGEKKLLIGEEIKLTAKKEKKKKKKKKERAKRVETLG